MPSRLLVLPYAFALALATPRWAAAAATLDARASDGPGVEADASFRERFPEVVEQLRSELPGRKSVDACAEVELRATAAGIAVKVSLPDGRATERDVGRAEDVQPTLHALLLVPELRAEPAAPSPAPAAPSPAPAAPPRKTVTRVRTLPTPERDLPEPAPGKLSENGFELSVVSGARVGDGQYGYGAGVLSFVQISRWLVGFQGRADGYRALAGSDPETALALGVLLGRRFEVGSNSLDFTAGPAVALRGASFSETQAVSVQAGSPPRMIDPATSMPPQERDIGPVPRLLLGARWGFSPRSLFRAFIGVDGELGPRRSADVSQDLEKTGRMPAYTVGLSLGATVGTR
jgi:hypothetical protein